MLNLINKTSKKTKEFCFLLSFDSQCGFFSFFLVMVLELDDATSYLGYRDA